MSTLPYFLLSPPFIPLFLPLSPSLLSFPPFLYVMLLVIDDVDGLLRFTSSLGISKRQLQNATLRVSKGLNTSSSDEGTLPALNRLASLTLIPRQPGFAILKYPSSSILTFHDFLLLSHWLPPMHRIKVPRLLFSTNIHGYTVESLRKLTGTQPHVLVVRHEKGVMGVFVGGWDESKPLIRSGRPFVFQLSPQVLFYPFSREALSVVNESDDEADDEGLENKDDEAEEWSSTSSEDESGQRVVDRGQGEESKGKGPESTLRQSPTSRSRKGSDALWGSVVTGWTQYQQDNDLGQDWEHVDEDVLDERVPQRGTGQRQGGREGPTPKGTDEMTKLKLKKKKLRKIRKSMSLVVPLFQYLLFIILLIFLFYFILFIINQIDFIPSVL